MVDFISCSSDYSLRRYQSMCYMLSRVQLFVTPWTAACQAPTSMGFYRQGYWSGLLFPSPGDLSDPGIEPGSLALQVDCLPAEPPGYNKILVYECLW